MVGAVGGEVSVAHVVVRRPHTAPVRQKPKIRPSARRGRALNSQAWKWALIAAPVVLSVSACVGWGGYPCGEERPRVSAHRHLARREVRHHGDLGSGRIGVRRRSIPTEMELDGKVTQRVGGDGTWKVNEFGGEQQLDVITGNEVTTFDLYRDKGRLLVALTVGDPDSMNGCILTRRSKTAANAPTAVQQRSTATIAISPDHHRP